eukprot:1190375-Prorocentrum_minimum.AAC.1
MNERMNEPHERVDLRHPRRVTSALSAAGGGGQALAFARAHLEGALPVVHRVGFVEQRGRALLATLHLHLSGESLRPQSPIRRRKRGYILTADQSDVGSNWSKRFGRRPRVPRAGHNGGTTLPEDPSGRPFTFRGLATEGVAGAAAHCATRGRFV